MVHNRLSSLLRRAQAGIVPRVHECVGGGGGVGVCARSPGNDRRLSIAVIERLRHLPSIRPRRLRQDGRLHRPMRRA